MILLVPISPEVPRYHWPKLWQGLVMILLMGIIFLETDSKVQADSQYIESLQSLIQKDQDTGGNTLRPELQRYLRLRPLLRIAPCRADWDLPRLLFANFLHGGLLHLTLNLIGVFAGARICATFIPFLCTFSIFIIGGTLGLLASIMLSSEVSAFVPHIGASAGIFALMGTYYIYNFGYRTKYFFWYPSKQGLIALKTSWFFFLDVILLEIVLSAAQLLPNHLDSVDHVAHVVGFGAGMLLAILLRFFQRWPSFLQTRGEFLYWSLIQRPKKFDPVHTPFHKWSELLEINPYNDKVKLKFFRILYKDSSSLSDEQIEYAFTYLTPTFVRLQTGAVSACLRVLLSRRRKLPQSWLAKMPYDSIIRLAKFLADPPEEQYLLLKFVSDYRKAHPEGGDLERKLELLMSKLNGMVTAPQSASFETPEDLQPMNERTGGGVEKLPSQTKEKSQPRNRVKRAL